MGHTLPARSRTGGAWAKLYCGHWENKRTVEHSLPPPRLSTLLAAFACRGAFVPPSPPVPTAAGARRRGAPRRLSCKAPARRALSKGSVVQGTCLLSYHQTPIRGCAAAEDERTSSQQRPQPHLLESCSSTSRMLCYHHRLAAQWSAQNKIIWIKAFTQSKQCFSPREGNPGNVLLTSRKRLQNFYQW